MAAAILNLFDNQQNEEDRHIFQELTLFRRTLRDTINPFSLPPHFFRKYFSLSPDVALHLLDQLYPALVVGNSRIPVHVQFLAVLRFLAEGGYQKGFSQDFFHPVSQNVASRLVAKVVDALVALAPIYIRFPGNVQERQHMQQRFQRTFRAPGVIGLIDCFLVVLKRPRENEEAFYNYRVGHAVNVQVVCDPDYLIRNIRICPGSNNDRHIYEHSQLRQHMKQLRANNVDNRRYYLLGDSGYTPSPVLLTPVLDAIEGFPEDIYTDEHTSTRSQIERVFGILTNIWQAIKRCKKSYYTLDKVTRFIEAAAVLHNYGFIHRDIEAAEFVIDYEPADHNNDDDGEQIALAAGYVEGIQERNFIINQYYPV